MIPILRYLWESRGEADVSLTKTLSDKLQISPLVAALLQQRGVEDVDQGRQYLACRLAAMPDPLLLAGMEVAVTRLSQAVQAGERIAVHGDYDVLCYNP
ncbi:hypothetical protein A7E78_04800 [Syntrophotalea acetylenivorans]|uniref:Single-stranded-DNA-specific exonuclease RecJ n=1 Tax=Syntrophotalea acetylenivorans TaxID=1842532 RepID=A0A1L3GMQ5_9BACT|nr:hypothetical protein [Syntrophotalea acetylenivorans]APG27214.1 hypothetical protein A7E78_04800 [Syntrophotalea acetylenivorans]